MLESIELTLSNASVGNATIKDWGKYYSVIELRSKLKIDFTSEMQI